MFFFLFFLNEEMIRTDLWSSDQLNKTKTSVRSLRSHWLQLCGYQPNKHHRWKSHGTKTPHSVTLTGTIKLCLWVRVWVCECRCVCRWVCECIWLCECVDLLDVVTEEDEVDTAEAQLCDDEEQVDGPPEWDDETVKTQNRTTSLWSHL